MVCKIVGLATSSSARISYLHSLTYNMCYVVKARNWKQTIGYTTHPYILDSEFNSRIECVIVGIREGNTPHMHPIHDIFHPRRAPVLVDGEFDSNDVAITEPW